MMTRVRTRSMCIYQIRFHIHSFYFFSLFLSCKSSDVLVFSMREPTC